MLVKDWMTKDPITLQDEDSLIHARNLMKRHGVRHLPVISEGKLVGILSDRDLRNYTPSYCSSLDVYEMHYMIAKLKSADAMIRHPVTVTPETAMARAGELMIQKRIGCLPVVNNEGVVGILTETDVIRALISADTQTAVPRTPKVQAGVPAVLDPEC